MRVFLILSLVKQYVLLWVILFKNGHFLWGLKEKYIWMLWEPKINGTTHLHKKKSNIYSWRWFTVRYSALLEGFSALRKSWEFRDLKYVSGIHRTSARRAVDVIPNSCRNRNAVQLPYNNTRRMKIFFGVLKWRYGRCAWQWNRVLMTDPNTLKLISGL